MRVPVAPPLLACLLLGGCIELPWGEDPEPLGITVSMDFGGAGFYDAPFPSDHRRYPNGTVRMADFPNPDGRGLVDLVVGLLDGEVGGFGLTSGLYFRSAAPIDPERLPDLHGSVGVGTPVFLVPIDPSSPHFGTRVPIDVRFREDAGPFGERNLITAVPLQGVPLRPGERYAAVVTTDLVDIDGIPLAPASEVATLLRGDAPPGLTGDTLEAYVDALWALPAVGVSPFEVAALSVFTTGDPGVDLALLVEDANAKFSPRPLLAFAQTDIFDPYCVYETRLEFPVYQGGTPPYLGGGGGFVWDVHGVPVVDHLEESRLVVTVPRATMPVGGLPTAVMIRTGAGGDRPIFERGTQDSEGEVLEPGTGPALHYARAGFAGVSVDGPHGGIRNITGGDEQFLIFNISNPVALRDNLRQSALELTLLPDLLDDLQIDVSDCPGAGPSATFDVGTVALMGHSMGATIAPLVLAHEPRFRATILSGAGGSWIQNVMYKESPLHVRPFAEAMIGYGDAGHSLEEDDPFLGVLQWAGESADPPVYGRAIVREPVDSDPRHVLMFQGIVDTYIFPPIANTTSLSLGLDLAGEALDEQHPDLQHFTPLAEVVAYGGGTTIDLPASGNLSVQGVDVTAVVVQHTEDGVEDGHEVMFQLPDPKHQYRCFLETFRDGVPVVPVGDAEGCVEP
jgi:pimeloyl-ACP methyl ester carboxylesterase